ncbi:MAG: hypothetical protein HN981_04485 [Candidatus Pacebacteria bacterium]|jgi:hypothetical protein|nr:hypothetical protein [Candidatus Paceibacterota bacterium]MBT4652503.1 hypothetical protein [Candidatus Paceibacterota bacterium]MBT6756330.1 hypothetical protein [Candidatus Paceibacterota bacterium]MBT6921621.1 hypothetical protein [Candidatus Paceibacterota bacterium]
MTKKIVVLTILALAIMTLTSCTGTKGEVVVLKNEQLVNPNGHGSCLWLSQQNNNCTLTEGEATIIAVDPDDPRYVLVQQQECQGWIVYSSASKK